MRRWAAAIMFGAWLGCSTPRTTTTGSAEDAAAAVAAPSAKASDEPKYGMRSDRGVPGHHRRPTGLPPHLSCEAARAIVDDVRHRLATEPPARFDTSFDRQFAEGIIDWADPHGLWTAAPDAPVAAQIRAEASKLRAALDGQSPCPGPFRAMGAALTHWIDDLRGEYDVAFGHASSAEARSKAPSGAELFEGVLEEGPPTRPGRLLARTLGTQIGTIRAQLPGLADTTDQARDRWLPKLEPNAWTEVLLAAAVRAWVPLIDPHGAWAPADESVTLYDRELEATPPLRLWSATTRTALGVRIDTGAAAPLRDGDVVVEVEGLPIAGLSAESVDQLAESDPTGPARQVGVLRQEHGTPTHLVVEVEKGRDDADSGALHFELVPFGTRTAMVVRLDDVPDALGEDLAQTIAQARGSDLAGILLDLRGNGGGSIDGATSTLGLFLAGAPLFPLRGRDGAIETERAAEPPKSERWSGPVATLVDAGTASAAEMIAGALHAYRRGPALGTLTYGKGCAQEYLDDVTGSGVLRLTTLLFALPDGSPVQRVGVRPDVLLPLPRPTSIEREADHPWAAPTWTGPDVRDRTQVAEVPWPRAAAVGPCSDDEVCRALRALGAGRRDVARR